MQAVLAKMLAAKVVTATMGVASATAVAVTAATGALPTPVQEAAHQLVGAPAPTAPADAEADEAGDKTAPVTAEQTKETPSPVTAADAHPSFVGLCHAYSAGNKATHGKALQSPAFQALVTAAGGETKVVSFCTPLLAKASPEKAHPPKAGTHKPAKDLQHGKPAKAAKHDKRAKAGHFRG